MVDTSSNDDTQLSLTSPQAPTTKETPFPNAAPQPHMDLATLVAGIHAMKHSNYRNYNIIIFKKRQQR